MLFLDMRTVVLEFATTLALCAVPLGLLWRQNRKRYAGLSQWFAGYLMMTLGMFLLPVRGFDYDFLVIVLSNFLLIGGILTTYVGLSLFYGRTTSQMHNYILVATVLAVHFFFLSVQPNLVVRVVVFSLGMALITGQCVWLTYQESTKQSHGINRGLAIIYSLFTLATLLRIPETILKEQSTDLFNSSNYGVSIFVIYQLLFISLTFGLFLLLNDRLRLDAHSSANARQKSADELDLRARELDCLYNISHLDHLAGDSSEEFLREIAKQIPRAWRFPEDTCARITFRGRSVCSETFSESPRKLSNDIRINGAAAGTVEVFRLNAGARHTEADRSFLPQEETFLKEICERLGRILERRQTTDDLHKSRTQLNLALLAAKLGVWHWRVDCNRRDLDALACTLLGLDKESFDGSSEQFFNAIHPDDREKIQKAIDLTLEFNLPYEVNYRAVWPDGSIHHICSRGRLFRDKLDDPKRIDGVLWDVTATKEAEKENEDIQERARQSEKLEAIGQLAGGVAHDFNNALASIMGHAEILLANVRSDANRKDVEAIIRLVERSGNLANSLLTFARKGQFHKTSVNVHDLINQIVSLLSHSVDRRISLTQKLHATQNHVEGDPNQLQNALLNLALNARDAMPNGGDLTFSTETLELDESQARIEGIPAGKYLSISVTDTGVGMDKATLKRLFEPFFTTKPTGQGTGMGLASVYGTVEIHHGKVSVTSELGHGSSFRVLLPAFEAKTEHVETSSSVRRGPTGHLLVVDDEEDLRNVLTSILLHFGYTVTSCSSGREAEQAYRKRPADLVILDLIMPDMSGAETFKMLKQIDPSVKVLLASGFSIDGDAQALLGEGALGFIQKPFRADALVQKISQILAAN